MNRNKQPLTADLIRRCFGRGARISGGFLGPYRVKTKSGGEVVIRPKEIKVISGGDDAYHATTLLIHELGWENPVARGSREFMMGAVLHGEDLGVNVRTDHRKPGAGFLRGLVVMGIVALGLASQDPSVFLGALIVALFVGWAMARSAKLEARRKSEEMGFHYPRLHGQRRDASREDAEREGWI